MTPLAFVAVAWGALTFAASVAAIAPWHLVQPELALLLVVYLGLIGRGGAVEQVTAALCIGYLADLFAGSPRGLHALTLGVVLVAARAARSRLMVHSAWQQLVVTCLAAIAHGALIVGLTSSMYGDEAAGALGLVPRTAVATALVAPLVFWLLRRVEARLQRDPRALRAA
jgi:rod shape-determining protein MreD